ncbi:hypothetical protein [Pseudonocardia hydrocarbonoxydans]|uniref:PIN-like domain-containing protein n=1 Tax=Pseudonocardia hydrocarbonoxydans TaxID=76726 RepID=UPI0014770D8C
MSSDKLPEFFLDRSLGKTSASRLRAAGHIVHLIADFYPRDAQEIGDAEWIAEAAGAVGPYSPRTGASATAPTNSTP